MKSTQFLPPYLSVNAFKYKYVALIQMLKHIKCKLDIKTHIWWSGSNLKLTRAENETERNWYKPARNPKQRKRNHRNETTETSETIETTKTKRLKPSHQTEKKKQSMIIKTLPFVLFRLWSTPDLTHGRIVLSIAMMWWFVLVVTVVSFSKLRWFRFVSVVTVVSFWWFRLFRLFRFGRLVSLFRVLVHAV